MVTYEYGVLCTTTKRSGPRRNDNDLVTPPSSWSLWYRAVCRAPSCFHHHDVLLSPLPLLLHVLTCHAWPHQHYPHSHDASFFVPTPLQSALLIFFAVLLHFSRGYSSPPPSSSPLLCGWLPLPSLVCATACSNSTVLFVVRFYFQTKNVKYIFLILNL
jgi:hypothetical protein